MNNVLNISHIEWSALTVSFVLLIVVFNLVRTRKMKENHSLLWITCVLSMFVLALKRNWLESIAAAIGIHYPPSALFLVFIFFIILILIHFSVVLCTLSTQIQVLSQKLALMNVIEAKGPDGEKSNPSDKDVQKQVA